MSETLDHLLEKLGGVYGGRRWIVATEVLAGATGHVKWLDRLGAEAILCVAAAPGAGDKPDKKLAPDPIVFDVTGPDMMTSIRKSSQLLSHLPDEAIARINNFDPVGTAKVIGTIFDDGRPVAGRRKFGPRPRSWQALEDKTTVDMLWDSVRIPRVPSRVVAADDFDGIKQACVELDDGTGTVWAADSREGFHGGAAFTRHVRTADEMEDLHDEWEQIADQIRVMPFLEGTVCSIHGWVFPDYVAVFRPCEMLVFRKPNGSFHYGRAASFWDPSDSDREQMRSVARRVGEYLQQSYRYRGAFTIDGVMTSDGFRPTELNPRFGAALGTMTSALDLDLVLLNLAVIDGEVTDWRPEEFEALVLESADVDRAGGTMAVVNTPIAKTMRDDLHYDRGKFRIAKKDEKVHARVMRGPHSAGGIVFITFDPENTPRGRSVAKRALSALKFADKEYKLNLGKLEAPKDVRK